MLRLDTDIKERMRFRLKQAGAVAVGFAHAEPVDTEAWQTLMRWIADGRHGALAYMENYPELRADPRGLLPDAETLVSIAWPYLPEKLRPASEPFIARYAYGPDYHKSIRRILKPVLAEWKSEYGFNSRVCVDSAPVLERYWAVRAGVGFTGRNGCLIVPGYGSWVFLSEILITASAEPDAPCTLMCAGCHCCQSACPTGALGNDGHIDCRRCLSALTLETPGLAPQGCHTLAGCDICQEVCPHNSKAVPHTIPAFASLQAILTLNASGLAAMDEETFRATFAGSALSRPGLKGLHANLNRLSGAKEKAASGTD